MAVRKIPFQLKKNLKASEEGLKPHTVFASGGTQIIKKTAVLFEAFRKATEYYSMRKLKDTMLS